MLIPFSLYLLLNSGSDTKSGAGIPMATDIAFAIGILSGLVIGKPLGIFTFSFIAAALGISVLPTDLKWNNIVGAGLLGGIGFTMSIFITLLAFQDAEMVNNAKIAILTASVIAGTLGYIWLRISLKAG